LFKSSAVENFFSNNVVTDKVNLKSLSISPNNHNFEKLFYTLLGKQNTYQQNFLNTHNLVSFESFNKPTNLNFKISNPNNILNITPIMLLNNHLVAHSSVTN
jgi:hypothetical protein